ncbi:endonuclease [Luteolibacter soli]|uniref:Endonuclease n=1 Tax=Luteolibacter soli TaxID=3135280 RepID=A0ABU9B350_9BACT
MSLSSLPHRLRFIGLLLVWLTGIALSQDPAYNPPAGYYSSTTGLTGTALKSELNQIIRSHTVIPYTGSGTDVWDALKVLDEDPNNSSNVILVYSGASWPKSDTNGDGNTGTSASWEREHCWPKSFGVEDTGPDTSDLFNLRSCRRSVNASRGNRIYDQANPGSTAPPNCPECLYDPDGTQGEIWTPRPSEKGDLARAIFYMAVRYDGRDTGTVDLELANIANVNNGVFGNLATLITWNQADPVSETERRRNHLIYTQFQHNRNPFIDHPEMVAQVFGSAPVSPVLTITMTPPSLNEGATGSGTVSIPAAVGSPVIVTLSKIGDATNTELSIPPSVTIPTGLTSIGFTANALIDGVFDSDKSVSVKAEAAGYDTGLTAVTIVNVDPPSGGGSSSTLITGPGHYEQNFNSLPDTGSPTWTDNQTIESWYAQRSGNGTTIVANSGSGTAGALYSYGTSAADRALGSLGSANAAAGSFAWGVTFRNGTSSTVTLTTLAYTGEQWRNGGAGAAQAITFSYQKGSTAVTSLTPTSDTGWTSLSALTFTSPINSGAGTALDGNAAANSVHLSSNVNLQLAPGEWITFRWRDIDHASTDHGLAIDDFRLDWQLPPPPVITSTLAASGQVGTPFSYTITASQSPTFFETESLPDGLSLNGSTGVISGTPTEAGVHEVDILAGNDGGVDVKTLVLTFNSAGTTFASWSGGATPTDDLILAYGVGGASSPQASSVSPVLTTDSGDLVLTAIVRVDDPHLSVIGEAVTHLANFSTPGLITIVSPTTAGVSQSGVPSGCERRQYRIATTGAARRFIRLRVELAN